MKIFNPTAEENQPASERENPQREHRIIAGFFLGLLLIKQHNPGVRVFSPHSPVCVCVSVCMVAGETIVFRVRNQLNSSSVTGPPYPQGFAHVRSCVSANVYVSVRVPVPCACVWIKELWSREF